MRRWWHMLAILAVVAMACVGLSFVIGISDLINLRAVSEVTAVVEGERRGTVVLHTERRDTTTRWLVDDSGEAVSWAEVTDAADGEPKTQDCAGELCYRVATTTLRVEASEDGGKTYAVAWSVDAETYKMLSESYPELGDPAEHLSSRSVVVHTVAGGYVVFVANGRDGLLYRDVRGTWHRLGSPGAGEGCCYYNPPKSISSHAQPTGVTLIVAGIVAFLILLSGGITAMIRRTLHWNSALAVLALAAMAAYGASLAVNFPTVGMFPGFIYGGPVIVVIIAAGVLLAVWFTRSGAALRAR